MSTNLSSCLSSVFLHGDNKQSQYLNVRQHVMQQHIVNNLLSSSIDYWNWKLVIIRLKCQERRRTVNTSKNHNIAKKEKKRGWHSCNLSIRMITAHEIGIDREKMTSSNDRSCCAERFRIYVIVKHHCIDQWTKKLIGWITLQFRMVYHFQMLVIFVHPIYPVTLSPWALWLCDCGMHCWKMGSCRLCDHNSNTQSDRGICA